MKKWTKAALAVLATFVVLSACAEAAQNAREASTTNEVESAEPTAPAPDRDARETTADESPTTTEAARDDEPAPAQEVNDEPIESLDEIEPALPDAAELDEMLADLDALLADLTNGFNQTEGEIQP